IVACHLAGKRVSQNIDNPLKRRNRELRRTDCRFRLIIRAEVIHSTNGKEETEEWVLENFRNEHNHEPSNCIQQCSRPAKRLAKKQKDVIWESVVSGLTVAQTHLLLQNRGVDVMVRTIGNHNRVEIERYK
ncbi:hypothetical protein BGX26_008675, partial [Mortierella sp. AD094]